MLAASAAQADIVVPGADGSDGAFSPVSNVTINLANSPTGPGTQSILTLARR